MGIFDRLWGKKPPTDAPPTAPPAAPTLAQPRVPQDGVIATFAAADGIGTIRLEDGATVSFGKSACRGDFVTEVGLPVRVLEMGPAVRGGLRATHVGVAAGTLAASDAALDRLHPIGDDGDGARHMGFATVLLDVALGSSRAALRAFLEPIAARVGGRVEMARQMPMIAIGKREIYLLAGSQGLTADRLDTRLWPKGAPLGRSFVCVVHGVAGMDLETRRMSPHTHDDWGADGKLRGRLRLLVALLEAGGVGVVAHAAGQVAYPKREWLQRVGDVDDLTRRGFAGLVDLGVDGDTMFTQGMDALGLPDVRLDLTTLGLDPREAYDRGHAAVLYACHEMVFHDRIFDDAEEIEVPVGVEVGCAPVESDNPGASHDLTDDFTVSDHGATIELRRAAPLTSLADLWESADEDEEDFPFSAHRLLVRSRLPDGWTQVARITFGEDKLAEGVPEHEVLVFAGDDGLFSTMTCGVGRRPQPNGNVEENNARAEFLLALPAHGPPIANFVSYLGSLLHTRGPDAPPWGPGDRVPLVGPMADLGYPFIVFGWGGTIDIAGGPPINLFMPVPMTQAERDAVPVGGNRKWLKEHGQKLSEARWAELLAVSGIRIS